MIRINLLPVRESKKQARLRTQAILLGVAAGAGVLICVGVHTAVASRAAAKRAEITTAQGELAQLEATRKEVERYRAEEEEITKKLNVIDSLEKARFTNVRIMDAISSRIPERMWLTELALVDGGLHIKGISLDAEVVAEFLGKLESAPDFHGVELEQTSLAEAYGLKLNSFEVNAGYGTPAAPADPAASAGAAVPAAPVGK
jgi:type IV pilus assembly protein PilN